MLALTRGSLVNLGVIWAVATAMKYLNQRMSHTPTSELIVAAIANIHKLLLTNMYKIVDP